MKLLPLTLLISLLLLSGCGQKESPASIPAATNSPNQANTPLATSNIPPSPDTTTSATQSANTGHYWKDGYKGLAISINRAEITKDVFDHEYLVFDITLQNGTDQPLDVSGRAFNLLTVNKELLEYDPTAETVETADNQTATVLSGGQRTLRVGFVVQPQEVSELIFNVGQNAVYRITSFEGGLSASQNVTVVPPVAEPKPVENTPAIEGGNGKSDDFIFEDNYLGYLNSIIEAVNTGDFSLVEIHLLYDSDLYTQQQKLVQKLSEKGTREELADYEIQSTSFDEENGVLTMRVREQIKVIALNGTEKMTDNVWTYTALQVDQGVFQFSSIAKAE
ncbi:hypothetical protein QW71_09680 [Paenibacillus sp. IHB B 3415]|uniref:TcaA NTF2-like domain-containing protein n=1 Tax=Paenibacillus sp. IHB B 3415 TaxID=867080 RepID=UPI0005757FAF|nr:hypothetical protein [Paenibacillus sp. IHB B 3415]KHL95872.1 hypothetical protein QW71_09680 [Paenibacillus sp. IHB B 3415]